MPGDFQRLHFNHPAPRQLLALLARAPADFTSPLWQFLSHVGTANPVPDRFLPSTTLHRLTSSPEHLRLHSPSSESLEKTFQTHHLSPLPLKSEPSSSLLWMVPWPPAGPLPLHSGQST